jgi:hypothetical protein
LEERPYVERHGLAAVRQVVESRFLQTAEFNPAFVLMQYIGYLRRGNPNDPKDTDHSGYDSG